VSEHELRPRRATSEDAAEIVRLRRLMFESMDVVDGDAGWMAAAEEHLRRALAGGDLVGAVVDAAAGVMAACGVIELQQRIPSPMNPSGASAYISTMSTDLDWRRRGLARAVLTELLLEARRRGVRRVELHATPAGAPLYRAVGFASRAGGDEMRLDLAAGG
jgi:GNAT superfamily N-acetyltransferase